MKFSPKHILAYLLYAGALVLLLLVAINLWHKRQSPPVEDVVKFDRGPRSLVILTLDTTGADHLEPYGAPSGRTPNLAALARRGIVFENAYSVAPITLVANTSIMTGLYPFESGVRNNGIHYLDPQLRTAAERFSALGYETGAFVSASVLDQRYGLNQGFDVYDDDSSSRRNVAPRMVADRTAPRSSTRRASGSTDWTKTKSSSCGCTSTILT